MPDQLKNIFPVSCQHLPEAFWATGASVTSVTAPDVFISRLEQLAEASEIPGFLPDLARLEQTHHLLLACTRPEAGDLIEINPTLQLIEVGWHPLLPLLAGEQVTPEPSTQILLFWQHPTSGELRYDVATSVELLALKVITEGLDAQEIAAANQQPVGTIDAAVDSTIARGLLLSPPSKLRRETAGLPVESVTSEAFVEAEVFTLQWHITHRCDLHCRHCYDRSDRKDVDFNKGLEVLDQLRQFCRDQRVGGQVSFSGGNPFLHPDFLQLYRAAHERNLNLTILGNPVAEEQLDALLQIATPSFYQVSLEGLEEHNDLIRGKGSYQSVLEFLDLLREKQIYSMVMLTLTSANLDQVLPLAEELRDRVDLFTYNRLAMVGEGANLESPQPEEYQHFVSAYLAARQNNPIMAIKDSLINIELSQQNQPLFGGCTGYGCGAAFNFFSLLPDGQVHACRKFPSPIGDINQNSLEEIYLSPAAQSYRNGCHECADCCLRLVCGGCLAVAHGWGHDPLVEKDPDCFMT